MELEPRTAAPVHATGAVAFVPLSALADDRTYQLREEGDVAALAAAIGRLGQLSPIELRPLPGAGATGPRYQVVAGFRRLAALRLLMRERVLARVHAHLDDDDAWGLALGDALLTEPLDRASLQGLRERLEARGVAPWAPELIEEAMVRAPVEPELREQFHAFLGGDAEPAPAPGDEPDEAAALEAAGGHGDDGEPPEAAPDAPADGEEEEASAAGADPEGPGEGEAVEVTPEELVAGLAARLYEVNADLAVAAEAWKDLPAGGRQAILEQVRWIADLLPYLEDEGDER